ncbi:hypothetical protein C8R27_10353 [Nitrosomonas ureae]|uniref:Uncharacterized protein n=1 Tax=Nitrosomonas ureae TaxID=44577 RepID=A0A286AFI5_9PROT|nr:hypothetical protein [Nitrosomonas ureae]PXX17642.1 hypothetical protein C8R27_10353 [Nitrosomonas ureae]SOD20637.1 hypothetical protein SAMN06297164_2680 [Nitrosomonas ureae]
MFIKIFLALSLGLSVSCFAEPDSSKSKLLIEPDQQKRSSTETNQQKKTTQSNSSTEHTGSPQSSQDTNQNNQPSMIEYCRKHTC